MIFSWWRWPCHECHHPRIPDIIRHGINAFVRDAQGAGLRHAISAGALGVFVFTYAMSYVQTYASERGLRDLRTRLATRISRSRIYKLPE